MAAVATVLMCLWVACSDLLVTEVADARIDLVVPVQGASVAAGSVRFAWDPVAGAQAYRLEIATPAFEGATDLLPVRAPLPSTERTIEVAPGTYQWRVTAVGQADEATSNIRAFTAVSLDSLNADSVFATRIVRLVSPRNGRTTRDRTVDLAWEELPEAESYAVAVDEVGAGGRVVDTVVTSRTLTVGGLSDGEYRWEVVAVSGVGTETQPSTANFTIDRTTPESPIVIGPREDLRYLPPVTIEWSGDLSDDFGLQIRRDSIAGRLLVDTTLAQTSYSLDTTTANVVFFRIIAEDAAGNRSPWTAWRQIGFR